MGRLRRKGRQKRTRGRMAEVPWHLPLLRTVPAPTANTITSTVTMRESAVTPSPPALQFTALLSGAVLCGGIPKSSDIIGIGIGIDVRVDIDIAGVDSGWW
jgi:hypothetical protein